jgi:hypothetical protein
MEAYFDEWKFKHPQPEDMRKTLERVSGKKLDWLFEDLIQTTNHVDYKIQCVHHSKTGGSTINVKNVGQVNGPIEVNVFDGDSIIETVWAEPGQRTVEVKTPKKVITKVAIDASKDIPEINRQNNFWRSKTIFPKFETPKIQFLFGDQDNFKNNLFYTPILAGNQQDKLMFGVALHNGAVPLRPTHFLLAPMFSLGNKSLAGIAELSHTILPKSNFKNLTFGANIKRFKADGNFENWESGLNYGSVYLQSKFGNRTKNGIFNHSGKISMAIRNEVRGANSITLGGGYAWLETSASVPDHRFKIQLRYDEMHELQNNSDELRRISLTADYSLRYLRNKMKRWIHVRGFFGNNLSYTNGSGIGNQYYQMALSGADGRQDLFMEEYYFDRFNPNSYIRNNNFGGFNSTSTYGTTSFWMATGNVYAALPIPKLGFLGAFCDGGAFFDGNTVNYVYNAGLGIRLGSLVGVYFPIVQSSGLGDLSVKYGNSIRMTLKFNPFSKPLSISGIGL